MKRLLFVALLGITLGTTAQAQFIDATINPIGALFGNFSAAAEFPITENMSAEPTIGFVFQNRSVLGGEFRGRGFSLGGRYKYYFSPREDNDRFYVNAYTRFSNASFSNDAFDDLDYSNTRLSLGVGLGFKVVADNGLVFDVGFGVGRALLNNYNINGEDNFGLEEAFGTLASIDADGRLSIGYRFGN